MLVGRVQELWRYPVKSMRGERISRSSVVPTFGMPGDRGWAIRDNEIGEIRGARKIGSLLEFTARYLEEPSGSSSPTVEFTFPDGHRARSDDTDIDDALSRAVDRPVSLWARVPADNLDHYRIAEPRDEQTLRNNLLLEPHEPIPDFSASAPAENYEQHLNYVTPPGTYFDAFALSALTIASMRSLAAELPDSAIDPRRFRQNLIIDTGDTAGYPETDWRGRRVRIGSLVVEGAMAIPRCVMITLPQGDLPRDRPILRTLKRLTGMNLGIYFNVIEPGEVVEGDPVELVE
jgi:uncharacterized protein YcbX